MDKDELYRIISKFPYISFDIFDTLMFRSVSVPEYVFDLVEHKYNSINKNGIFEFRKIRHQTEIAVREQYYDREVTIDEIYTALPYEQQKSERIKNIEKKLEIALAMPNICMVDLVNRCYENGNKVIITSDMYLDKDTIKDILAKIGAKYHILFLSSEIGCTKASGRLFPELLKRLEIAPNEIVHLGDNPISDIKMPNQCGIRSYERLVDINQTVPYWKTKRNDLASNQLKNFLKNNFQYNDTDKQFFRIGFCVLGPMLVEFCRWIHEETRRRGVNRLLFVAREGYLIEKIYNIMYPDVKTEYVRLNKNLLRLPALYIKPTATQFLDTIPTYSSYRVSDLLAFLMVDEPKELIGKLKEKFNINTSRRFTRSEIQEDEFRPIIDMLIELSKPELKKQYFFLLQYLKQIGIGDNKVALINNSINGNGQRVLEEILGDRNQILGLQFVKSRKCIVELGNRCIAWLDNKAIPRYYSVRFTHYVLLLEHLLFEPVGTALRLCNNGERVDVICEKSRLEQNNYSIVEKIQKEVCRFAFRYREIVPVGIGIESVRLFFNFVMHPEHSDAELLCGLYDDDVNDKKLVEYTPNRKMNLIAILSQARNYDSVKWGQGYLVQCNKRGFCINLYNIVVNLQDLFKNCVVELKLRIQKSNR